MESEVSAGKARFAANILVEVWTQLGSDYADYDVVWTAKEYLFDAADTIEQRRKRPRERGGV